MNRVFSCQGVFKKTLLKVNSLLTFQLKLYYDGLFIESGLISNQIIIILTVLTFPCCFSIRRIHSVISTESLDESNNNFIFLMFARLSEEQQFKRGGRSNKDNKPSFVQVRGTCQLKIFLKITGRGIQLNFNFIQQW